MFKPLAYTKNLSMIVAAVPGNHAGPGFAHVVHPPEDLSLQALWLSARQWVIAGRYTRGQATAQPGSDPGPTTGP